MRMRAITRMLPPAPAAARAVAAGHDVVLDSRDDRAALAGVGAAVADGTIGSGQLDASVRRILEAKARLGLHRGSRVDLDALPELVGTRAHRAVAREVSERSITLIRDAAGDVPATGAARRSAALPVGARLPVGLGHRRAEPARDSGTPGPLARR